MKRYRYPVQDERRRWGYIDETGALAIGFRFENAGSFGEGLAAVGDGECVCVINAVGEMLFKTNVDIVGGYSFGLAVCRDRQQRFGYINREGSIAIPMRFDGASTFRSGIAVVRKGSHFGLIRIDGSAVVECQMDFCHSFSNQDRVTSFKRNGKWGLVSADGEFMSYGWEFCHQFSEGIVPVRIGGSWGLADELGKLVLSPQFAETNFALCEGRIGVTEGTRWWYIDAGGNRYGPDYFTYVEEMSSGRGAVYVGGKYDPCADMLVRGGQWGYVDVSGALAVPPRYDDCEDFDGPLARVEIGDLDTGNTVAGYIDHAGNTVWPPIRRAVSGQIEGLGQLGPRLDIH